MSDSALPQRLAFPCPASAHGSLSSREKADKAKARREAWPVLLAPSLPQPPRLLGLLAFGDSLKPDARDGVAALQRLGLRTVLISGDNRGSAAAVAAQLGITEVHAEVLPGDKAAIVRRLQVGGTRVAIGGDGVNDAPALAAADVGIAMSPLEQGLGGDAAVKGTDVAMQAAGITLMRGDVRQVAGAIAISRRTHAKIRQNLFWAFAYNTLGIPLAAFGLLSPVIAGAAMALPSVSVVGNALLLTRWRGEDAERQAGSRGAD